SQSLEHGGLGLLEQRQLVSRRRCRRVCAPAAESRARAAVRALQLVQDLPGPRNDIGGQARQPADFDAVAAVRTARLQVVQEYDIVSDLAHRDIEVDELRQQLQIGKTSGR